MRGNKDQALLRILDANLNRSREGLRVCEEILRFILQDERLTRRLKKARHAVSSRFKRFPSKYLLLLAARNVRTDVGKKHLGIESGREGFYGLFAANSQRAKEALRVLEEVSKILGPAYPGHFKKIRFEVYEIEKRVLPKLEALRDHRGKRS